MAIVDGGAVMILIVIVTFHDMVRTRAGWPLAFKLIPTPGPTLATALVLLPHAIKHHEIKSCSQIYSDTNFSELENEAISRMEVWVRTQLTRLMSVHLENDLVMAYCETDITSVS